MFNSSIENKFKQIKSEKIIPSIISKTEINDDLNKIEDYLNKMEIKESSEIKDDLITTLKNILGKDDIINSKYNTYYIILEIVQALESNKKSEPIEECENDVCIY